MENLIFATIDDKHTVLNAYQGVIMTPYPYLLTKRQNTQSTLTWRRSVSPPFGDQLMTICCSYRLTLVIGDQNVCHLMRLSNRSSRRLNSPHLSPGGVAAAPHTPPPTHLAVAMATVATPMINAPGNESVCQGRWERRNFQRREEPERLGVRQRASGLISQISSLGFNYKQLADTPACPGAL